ncbi:hypothetical protein BJI47_10665 [Rhodococcus sp. 1168]|nr:hypothetical protein BJI47_10665 [Rhodococcus sp. 1168]
MFIQVIETRKAFDEGVLDSESDANIGTPPGTGGVRQFATGDSGGREPRRSPRRVVVPDQSPISGSMSRGAVVY